MSELLIISEECFSASPSLLIARALFRREDRWPEGGKEPCEVSEASVGLPLSILFLAREEIEIAFEHAVRGDPAELVLFGDFCIKSSGSGVPELPRLRDSVRLGDLGVPMECDRGISERVGGSSKEV